MGNGSNYGHYQMSLTANGAMFNCCADDIEEFKQRVKDTLNIAETLKQAPTPTPATTPKPQQQQPDTSPAYGGTSNVPVPVCSYCHGNCWDNRGKKKTPNGPDFKCKACGSAAWINKNGTLYWKEAKLPF